MWHEPPLAVNSKSVGHFELLPAKDFWHCAAPALVYRYYVTGYTFSADNGAADRIELSFTLWALHVFYCSTGFRRMKAITIDAIWAWLIMQGYKRTENRTWRTRHRGPIAIHAGVNTKREDAARAWLHARGLKAPSEEDLAAIRGKVVCIANIDSCEEFSEAKHSDPFATGPVCWRLSEVKPLAEPMRAAGLPGIWTWQR